MHQSPTVIGKRVRIDHHHLARALWDGGITEAFATVVGDLSRLPESEFWDTVIERRWVHPQRRAWHPAGIVCDSRRRLGPD
ncbi:ParB-like protein [Paraburkholderia strydomiana]|uniref:ParB-like protein n=1 Tax=Paraburkholderia strydomiana TaxID=1245417 RepID=UPI0038BBD0C7